MPRVFVRGFNNYDVDEASAKAAVSIAPEERMTQQQFKDECDINTIVRRFGLTGVVPQNFAMPQSGDFTGVTDFHTAMNVVRASQEAFMTLPGEVRARFANSPQRLMDFLHDPQNRDEAIRLGLAQKPAEVPRDAVRAIDDLAAVLAKPAS